MLSSLDGNDFSSIHFTTQQLFCEGVKTLQAGDESKVNNVLVVIGLACPMLISLDSAGVSESAVRETIS